jgi:SAM-dependent methyltransferase
MNPEFWNQKFIDQPQFYGLEPNAWFKEKLQTMQPGRLLLAGEGEGRNAAYALKKGWSVQAFDHSEVAKVHAIAAAGEWAVSLDYRIKNLAEVSLEEGAFDAAGLIYIHLPAPIREDFHKKVVRSLKPGGKLILEGFEPRQLPMRSGGPKEESMLFTVERLRKDFKDLKVLHLDYAQPILSEGAGHAGPAFVLQMLAERV